MDHELSIAELQEKLAVAEDALCRSEERATAGQLALELMHEIRNPLEALGHLTYLALAEADNPAKVREHLTLAEEQVGHVNQIASQTLRFTRQSDSSKPTDLVFLMESALRIHQRKIRERQIRLVKDLPEKIIAPVHTGQMLQVISNLLVNAVEALPDNGTLSLRIRQRNGEVHLVFADNGHGIPTGNVPKIFEPFFTTKPENGTGLGLAVTRKIVENHRGRIRLRSSVRPGHTGTIFKISIPA